MPRKCSIFGYRGNYRKQKNTNNEDNIHVRILRFLKDDMKKMASKFPQKDQITENITDNMDIRLCEHQFDTSFVIWSHTFKY